MKPVIAIVGRPNVGKSTLFNRLTRSRDAIVADFPGLTRDRHYGEGRMGERPFIAIDTGGFEPIVKEGIVAQMAKQTEQAIAEADAIIFLTDGRSGLSHQDHEIAIRLRRCGRPVILGVNKTEGMSLSGVTAEFYELGLGEPVSISAAHGDGVRHVLDQVLDQISVVPAPEEAQADEAMGIARPIRLAIVGRPNVGKSTLINTLLGEERVIAFDAPGTTRDAIEIPFEREGRPYVLIDTAGIRRRGKVFEAIEKFSVVKTLQAISDAHVVILLTDAQQDISEQDAHIASFIVESGRALVVGVNKWDGLESSQREWVKREMLRKLAFLDFARFHFVSALKQQGIGGLLHSVTEAYAAATANLSTPRLTRALIAAVQQQQPPRKGSFRPKLRYAHQGGQNPPVVVIHGSALDGISASYRRYLEGRFRETFALQGTPLRVEFKSGHNPYVKNSGV